MKVPVVLAQKIILQPNQLTVEVKTKLTVEVTGVKTKQRFLLGLLIQF